MTGSSVPTVTPPGSSLASLYVTTTDHFVCRIDATGGGTAMRGSSAGPALSVKRLRHAEHACGAGDGVAAAPHHGHERGFGVRAFTQPRATSAFASSTIASTVKPNFFCRSASGALAPNDFIATHLPRRPT